LVSTDWSKKKKKNIVEKNGMMQEKKTGGIDGIIFEFKF